MNKKDPSDQIIKTASDLTKLLEDEFGLSNACVFIGYEYGDQAKTRLIYTGQTGAATKLGYLEML